MGDNEFGAWVVGCATTVLLILILGLPSCDAVNKCLVKDPSPVCEQIIKHEYPDRK